MKQYNDLTAQDKAGFVEVAAFNSATELARADMFGNPGVYYDFNNDNSASNSGRTRKAVAVLLLQVAGCSARTYNGPVLWKRVTVTPPARITLTGWNLCGTVWGRNTSLNTNQTFGRQISEIVYRDAQGRARYFTITATPAQAGHGTSYSRYTENTSDSRFAAAAEPEQPASADMSVGVGIAVANAVHRRRRRRRRWWNDDE